MSTRSILIVEDECTVAAELTARLARIGWRVAGHCTSGEDALRAAQQLHPDLVLMDIQLPGVPDGIETACRIRHNPGIPVVFLTDYAEEATLQRAQCAEPFGYVLKPFDDRDLQVAIAFARHKHEAERKLREREETYRTLFETVPQGVVYQDLNGHITSVNPAAERMLGLPVAELCQRSSLDKDWQALRADGSPFPGEEHPAMVTLRSGQPVHGVLMGVFNPRLRQQVWLEVSAVPLFRDGSLSGVYTCFEDVTARRHAERALMESEFKHRLLAEHSLDWIFWQDRDGHFRYCSPSCQPLTGHRPEDFGTDPDLFERLLHPDDLPAWQAHRSRRALADVTEVELRLCRPDGTLRWIAHRCQSVFDTSGVLLGHRGTNRDITERRELDRELQTYREHLEAMVADRTAELTQAKDAAEAADRAKSAFLANISHEIRTPLNAIMGLAHLAEGSTNDPQLLDRLRKIGEAGEKLLRIINDVLDFSRIEAGKLTLTTSSFTVAETVNEVCRVARHTAEGKGIALRTDIDPRLSEPVGGDALRLRQVLMNLVDNAVKFTDRGWVVVRADVERDDADLLRVRFEVEDTGTGIVAERKARLFRAFEPGDATTTRRHGGAGLGLAISQRLVALMHGEIQLESSPGAGSRFWFTVDLRRPAQSTATVLPPRDIPASEALWTAQFDSVPGLDWQDGVRRVQGRHDRYAALLRSFAEIHHADGALLQAALTDSDPNQAVFLAHALKGSAANLGASRIGALAAEIELDLREGKRADDVQQLAAHLERELKVLAYAVGTLAKPAKTAPDERSEQPPRSDLIERLGSLLAEDNIEARGLSEEAAPVLRETLGARYEVFERQIAAFEFAAAYQELRGHGPAVVRTPADGELAPPSAPPRAPDDSAP